MGYVLLISVLPWLAALLWLVMRAGWSVLLPDETIPSQASRLRSFGGSN